MCSSKNTSTLFMDIKDRVWEKVRGWTSKMLSTGGKEVLLKAVVQSIPIYSMRLFRLPKGLIANIHHMCARFWWGSSDDAKKIH